MAKLLEQSKYIVLIAVFGLLVAALATFVWGVVGVASFVVALITSAGSDRNAVIQVLEVLDTFLVGTVLLISGLGLYELFIGKLALPEWLVIDDLSKLKSKLADVIVLIMAIKFLDKLVTAKESLDVVWTALAVAIVSGVLIALNAVRDRGK